MEERGSEVSSRDCSRAEQHCCGVNEKAILDRENAIHG
jgi:hypothetical protein